MISLLTSLKICKKDLGSFDRQIYLIVKPIEHCWLEQRKAGRWGEDQGGRLLAASWAKLYYTFFWDKFRMNIYYFGMHPKT